MCGRFASTLSGEELGRYFSADEVADVEIRPSWNIAPTQQVPIVLEKRDDRRRLVTTARWSLVPSFSKTLALPYPTFNARSETVCEKASFRGAIVHQRAIIPAAAYYEWHTEGKTKTPYAVSSDDGPLAFAGIYSWWREDPSSDWVLTATILTMAAPEPIAWLHDRTPVVLGTDEWDRWLNRETSADQAFVDDVVARSVPVASQLHTIEVNPLRGDGPELLQPADRGRL